MSQTEKVGSSWWVWGALLATLVLCYFAAQNSEEADDDLLVVTSNKRSSAAPNVNARPASSGSVSTSKSVSHALTLSQTAASKETISQNTTAPDSPTLGFREASATPSTKDLFHPYVPPVKKVTKVYGDVAPPPPVAPKAPFQYVGKLEDDGKTTYFFMAQQRLVSGHLGDKLDGQWKLEGEEAQTLQLQYVPLALRQSLPKQALGKAVAAPNDTSTQVTQ